MGHWRDAVRRGWKLPSLWVTFGLAAALVGSAVSAPREADRTATQARIPLRALTPEEADILLTAGAGRLARIGPRTVDLVTEKYLLPIEPGPAADDTVERHGRRWQLVAASWDGYWLRYRLDRGPLERELALGGRPLRAFYDPAAAQKPVSFASDRLAGYAGFEIVFLGLVFFAAWTIVRRVRPFHWVAPAICLLGIGYVWAVNLYAPAFFDADFFYQRWVVEEAVPWLFHFGGTLALAAALSLAGLLCLGLLRLLRHGRPLPTGMRLAASWAPVALLLLGSLAEHGILRLHEQRTVGKLAAVFTPARVAACRSELQELPRRFPVERRVDVHQLPPRLRELVDRGLAAVPPPTDSGGFHALLPIDGSLYFFLWRNASFYYLDVRELGGTVGRDEIDTVLATRRPYATSYLDLLRVVLGSSPVRFYGRPVLGARGQVVALVYTERSAAFW